jgi:hypothetical protein
MIERALQRHATLLFGVSALLLVAIYLIVGGIYRPQNLDDGWTLSALYQYHVHGIEQDKIFGATLASEGQDGVYHFAKIQALIYGAILDIVGWTQSAGHAVSTLFVGLGAVTWGLITKRLTGRSHLAVATVILLLLSEPFFGPANQSRPEALTFFFAAAALALYIYDRPLLSGLFIGLAFEVHPAGLFAGLYVASAFFAKATKTGLRELVFSRQTALLLLGSFIGLSVYLLLHAEAISTLLETFSQSNTGFSNFLIYYFFMAKYMRHIPELIFFSIMLGVFVRGRHWREAQSLSWLLLIAGASLLVLHRGSIHYVLYLYAPLMLISLWVADRYNKLLVTYSLCLVLFVSQYGAIFYLNRSYSFEAYSAAVSKAVPNDGLAVAGTSNDWFIFQERVFYAFTYGSEAFNEVAPSEFYLIRNDSPYMSFPKDRFYANIDRTFNCGKISSFTLGGERVQIDRCER